MSRTSLDIGSCHATNSAPWLFSDPYAYQYADIPSHIRQISATRQEPRNAKEGQALSVVTTAVEAGSVPVFEMEGCTPKTPAPPKTSVLGAENTEVDSGLRFELGDSSTINVVGDGLARLTITPSVTGKCSPGFPAFAAVSSPQAPGCLQIGGGIRSPLVPSRDGDGIELYVPPVRTNTPSTPTTPTGSGGLLRRSTANRAPGVGSRRFRAVTTMPSAAVAEARLGTPPPPYPTTVIPPPLSALPPHLRHHKRQSYSVSSPISTPTSPAPASDLASILNNIQEDHRRARDSVYVEDRRRGSRGSRAYQKYCDNN
ncbi:uncharacterized protein PG998_004791 [Apiospora kogelbergensis]|uniref:uncharacterized protein n=1 Tax=Apiospora kogelbergensis TaxID=1337665 RepID=UPI00312DBCA6